MAKLGADKARKLIATEITRALNLGLSNPRETSLVASIQIVSKLGFNGKTRKRRAKKTGNPGKP